MTPALGRDFRAEEETDGRHRVVLLSDGLWRRRFGADPSMVGRTIAFDGNAVRGRRRAAGAFWWPTRPDVVVPLALDDHDRTLRAAHFLDVVGRLRDGVSPAQAREDLRIIGAVCRRPSRPKTPIMRRTCGRCATRSSATCARRCSCCSAPSRS